MTFKIVPLCNYRPATGKVLEIFIFCDSYSQLLRRILTYVSSIIMRCLFNADFSPETGKNLLRLGQGGMGNPPESPLCSLLINPWPKSTGVLEHCHEGQTNDGSPFFEIFPSDRIPKATKDVNLHFLTLILLTWRIGWAHNNARK